MDTSTCMKCGIEYSIGDWPWCPHGKPSGGIVGDDIPGGMLVKHGICWPDGTPRKFYSKTEIKQAAHEAGWTIEGETPKPNQKLVEAEHKRVEEKAKIAH